MTPMGRFLAKISFDRSGCWLWTAALQYEYGSFTAPGRRSVLAHRWAYEQLRGPIPEGLTLDHLCGVKRCVNPDHLEPVTIGENVRRWSSKRTTCPQGHAYDYVAPDGWRGCRLCRKAAKRRYKAKKLIGALEQPC